MDLVKGSYQDELDHFFKTIFRFVVDKRVVTKAALTKARMKLKYIDRLTQFLNVRAMDKKIIESVSVKRDNVQRDKSLYTETKKEFVSSGMKDQVFDYFKDENWVFSELVQFDLGKHGYY